MKPGLRPRIVSQIFAPVPAARSRCLSAFVAISRQGLPIALRYEPSHLLGASGISLLLAGFLLDGATRYGGLMMGVGWGSLGLAFLATLCQDRFSYGRTRWRLIRQLDEVRRSVGLDEAILPESLDFLENSAQQWERIEHAMQSSVWQGQLVLRERIERAAHILMEDLVILECGNTAEAGLSDQAAVESLAERSYRLRWLADQVDATGAAMTTYPRIDFDSNGVEPVGVIPELADLEEVLSEVLALPARVTKEP